MATARQLAALTPMQRHELLAGMSPDELAELEFAWEFWARRDQLPPPGTWRTWLLLGGRGSGKTRSAAEWVRAEMESGRRRNMAIIAPTADSARSVMVEGPSGLLAIAPDKTRPSYEPSTRKLVWPNGGIVRIFSAEEPERLRGPNVDGLWADEICAWANAPMAWDMAQMALRIKGPQGHAPCGVVSTTPKPSALIRQIVAAPTTMITRARTSDNAANLDASTLAYYQDKYGGTRLGRQELDGELIADLEGALWTRDMIEAGRIRYHDGPSDVQRVVVAVDPPGGSTKSNAECGIIIAAVNGNQFYVLADLSGRMSPEKWAKVAVDAYYGYAADRVVAERNFGGDMVESVLRRIDPNLPIRMVTASRGKAIRAEPIVALYEQHRVHHVGDLPQLEDQMCGWAPAEGGSSPDRLDALVWALTDLSAGATVSRFAFFSVNGFQTEDRYKPI